MSGSATWTLTSSGEQIRHRLSRAGNRRLNHVIHIAAIVQIRHDTEGTPGTGASSPSPSRDGRRCAVCRPGARRLLVQTGMHGTVACGFNRPMVPTPGDAACALAEQFLGRSAVENSSFLMGYAGGLTYMGSAPWRRRRATKAYLAFRAIPDRLYTLGWDDAHYLLGSMAAVADVLAQRSAAGMALGARSADGRGRLLMGLAAAAVAVLTVAALVSVGGDDRATTGTATAKGPCADATTWFDAAALAGERAAIAGPVVSVVAAPEEDGSPTFLNVGEDYPSSDRLSVVIWGADADRLGMDLDDLVGQRVCVVGEVDTFDGVAQMTVRDRGELQAGN